MTRARAREVLHGSRTEEAFSRFELLERRADFAEGRADALALLRDRSFAVSRVDFDYLPPLYPASKPGQLLLALCQPVGGHQQRRNPCRMGGFDDHRNPSGRR